MMAKNAPLFSIITVSLNNLDGLKATHASLKAQSCRDFEWIVMDGGSTDGTMEHLKSTDARWTSKKDDGIYDAMNGGMAKAKGHYLLFLNAGDALAAPSVLDEISKHTEKTSDFIFGDALETRRGSKPFYKRSRSSKELPSGMFTHHQAMLYARRIIRQNKMHYSLLFPIAADYDFTARFLQQCKKVVYLPQPICLIESGGLSQQQAYQERREQYLIRDKLELCSQWYNFWIFIRQGLAWRVRTLFPWAYRLANSS